jgi:alkylated DNA repair dioxygenase AlkB
MAYRQQQTLVCSAKAEVRQNQPSHSAVDTAAPSGQTNCSGNENNSSKVLTMSYSMSALLLSLSIVVKSVKKVAPSMSMRNKVARASRKAQQRLARAKRQARQVKNGWLRSSAYQKLCREADHASRISCITPPASSAGKAGSSSRPIVKYSRLSDGEGVYALTPAIRVHRTFVAPVTRRERHLAAREQLKAAGLLPNQAPALGKALKEQRKAKAKVKSLTFSPVARPRDIEKAAQQLEKAAAKAARLSEVVKVAGHAVSKKKEQREEIFVQKVEAVTAPPTLLKLAARCQRLRQRYYKSQDEQDYKVWQEAEEDYAFLCKKKEQREEIFVQEVVTPDDFLAQLEFLRTQLDQNMAPPVVPQEFATAAAEIVDDYKAQAEATGTKDMTMLMSLSSPIKNSAGEDVQVITITGNWSGNEIDPQLKAASKDVMVNLVGKNKLQKAEFTKRGFVLVTQEWYCLPLEQNKQLIKETPVRPPIVSRTSSNPPKLVKTDRADGVKYLHLYPNSVTPKNIKELLAEPKELEVLVNISSERLIVENRDKFVEFLRANGFENYSTHADWLVLPAGRKFAERVVKAGVVFSEEEESFNKLWVTVDGVDLVEATLAPRKPTENMDDIENEELWNRLGIAEAVRQAVATALSDYLYADVWFSYDTSISLEVTELLAEFGFASKYDCFLLKPALREPVNKDVKSMYITVHTKTKAGVASGSFTVGDTTIPVEVDQKATEPANRLLCVKQAIAYAINAGAKAVSVEVSHANYDLNKLAAWKAAGFKGKSNVELLKDIESLTHYLSVTWVNPKNKAKEVANTVVRETVAQVTKVQASVTTSHKVIGGEAYAEEGLLYYPKILFKETRDLLLEDLQAVLDSGAVEKTSFGPYQYTCLGDYYWTWENKKGVYSTTQPNGSPVAAVPKRLREIVEVWLNGELKVWEGQYVVESCLVNFYEGKQKLNCHQDISEEIDAPIVSFSFGATGRFLIREGARTGRISHEFTLSDSDLLVMYGKHRYCWHEYAGNIESGTRINLTFRMVKKPVVTQPEVRTVEQRTVKTERLVDTTAVKQNQQPAARTVQDRVRVNPDFKPQPRAKTLPEPGLLPQSEVGRISGTPQGCSHIFDFKNNESKKGLDEVIVAAFAVRLDPVKGQPVECNINTPSYAYNDEFTHYGYEDTLTTKKGENMNVISLGAAATKALPAHLTPIILSVCNHCLNGVREEFIPTALSSVNRVNKKANLQIILGQPGGESCLTKEKAIQAPESSSRQKMGAAILEGESKEIPSVIFHDDGQGHTPTFVKLEFSGDGLETILADGKRHIFIVVAWYDKSKQTYFEKGGKQYRIYPHTASVFHVDDLEAVFGGQKVFKFDERALLGLSAEPVVEAKAVKPEVKALNRPLIKPEPTKATSEEVTEVQQSVDKANLAKELADLHKATRLKGLPLTKGLTEEDLESIFVCMSPDGQIAHRTLSYIKSRTDGKPVQLFDWTKADVLKVAKVFVDLLSPTKATADQQVFRYRNTEEGLLLSFDAGTIEFLIGNDGRAYNAADGRAFEQGMELIGYNALDMSWWDSPEYAKAKAALAAAGKKEPEKDVSYFQIVNGEVQTREEYKPEITDVCFSSSIGKFMQAFCAYLLMFAQSKNNTRGGLGDNFKILLNKCESVISMTEGDILGQNGGFLYSVQNSPKLYVHREQCDIFALEEDKLKDLANSVATVVKGYDKKPPEEMLKVSSTDTQSLAMKEAFKKYPALGFHFAKGTFINGLTHLRLATLQKYAPNLFNKTLQLTGLSVEAAVESVVSLTLKASKGAKRATLALARAVEVLGEVKAGWAFYGQEKVLTGWLVQECMAPTFVMAPGMSFFLGNEEEKPVALVKKTQTQNYPKFLASNLAEAVSMTGVTEYQRCLADHRPTQTYDEVSATYRITFDKEVKLIKGTEIAFVKKEEGQGADAVIIFNDNERATLNEITWRVHKDLVGESVLVVNYSYTLHHRNPKLRGVIKTMMASCSKELLYNFFNEPKLTALGLKDIKLVCPQDTIKSDMLYSWLMVIGNTIRHNDPTNPHIAKLISLRDQLNEEMMGGADYDPDTIVINPAAVVAGLYSDLIAYFVKHFGHSLWMHVQQPEDQGEIMNRLYVDRVAQKAGWVEVPKIAWGEYEEALATARRMEGYTVKLYAESVDYLKNDKQNALLFTLDADGVVVEYFHRSFCFVGAEGAPVYGVELFESSTVAEAISDSRHMPPSVRSLSRMEGVAFDDAWALLNAGKEKMFMSLVIAGMSSCDKFNCSKTITILERGAEKDKNLILSPEDKDYFNSILVENKISLDFHEEEQFKAVAYAFRDIVFVAKGKTYWLPALFAINSLKSENSTNNLAQQFFRDILVECLAGRTVPAIEGSRAAGILDSLCDSASTKKLITAADNMAAKRIALAHIPAGEIHILKSTHPASNYQNLLRHKFDLKSVEAGKSTIFVHNSRAPLTDGCLLKLVIVTEEQNSKNFWKLDSDSFALGSMGNGMDFGDFDGDGHYFVQLVGTDYTVSTFDSIADFITDAVGYNIFNTYANPENKKGEPNEAYLADHYNIKKWSKVDETLCNMGVKKATKSSATYLMYNQNAREMQAKATGIAYSVYMWSEHLVDILLAYKKLGGVLPFGFEAAADGSLVAPISQVYEVILGGFSDPAWAVYTKYFLKMKEGERTVFDHNLAEFNKDLMAMGITGQKQAGFSALMFASYHLFFLEKWGEFNDYEVDMVTKNPLPLELKGMLACALVSFELMRGKFQGFVGALEVEKGGKVTGHKTAMNFARTFLLNNPGMVSESLVCKQLAQTIEVCNHLLEGKPRPERTLATPGVIQERTVAVPTSNLSDEALQYFLTKVGASAVVKETNDSDDEGGSKVSAEPNTPDNGDGGAAVEAIDYAAYLETEEVAAPTIEELVSVSSAVVEEYYSESELEEPEFAATPAVLTTSEPSSSQYEFDADGFLVNWLDHALATINWQEETLVIDYTGSKPCYLLKGEGLKLHSLVSKGWGGAYYFEGLGEDKKAPVIFMDQSVERTVKADQEFNELVSSWAEWAGETIEAPEEFSKVLMVRGEVIIIEDEDEEEPVQSEVIENGTKQKMATLMQVVEQLPESALDKLLAEGERLLAELTKTKEPVREALKTIEPTVTCTSCLTVAEPVTDEAPSIDIPSEGTQKQSIVSFTSRTKRADKPEVTNSSSREILQAESVVENVEVVKAHPLDGLAPLRSSTAKHMIKDIAMAAVATQFIGTSAVSKPSSTELYRQAWADWKSGCANTGVYTAADVVMVSGNGLGRATEAQIVETFAKSYIPYLLLVINAKATVVVGDCPGMDCCVRDYLVGHGYQNTWVAAKIGGYNRLTPPTQRERKLERAVVKQSVEAVKIQPEGDWVEALVSKLEPWTGNQIKKALATLSSEQLEAARIIIQHALSNTTAKVAELDPKDVVGGHILTGKAGTGKTYATLVIIIVLDLLGFRVVACGTTGLASQNLKNSSGTINRVLSLGTGFEERKDTEGNLLPRTEADISQIILKMSKDGKVAKRLSEQSNNKNYIGVVLLVDEAFMLGGDLGIAAAEGLKTIVGLEAQNGKVRQRPIQLLMVGDPKQLEPVKDRMIFEEGEFLEYSDSTEVQKYHAFTDRLNLKVIKLEKNERQSGDTAFGLELDLLGEGKAKTDLSNCPVLLSRFKASLSCQPADALHIIYNNDEVAKFNKSKLDELVKKGAFKRKFEAIIDSSRCGESELLSYVAPTPRTLELVVGAPVRVTQNIPKNDGTDNLLVANGERGVVASMTKDKVTVKFKDGRFEELEAVESRKIPVDENGAPIGSFRQLPLCLCWATTFHGSQGQTYPKGEPVIVHMYSRKGGKHDGELQRVWSNNAFYVACSRVTRSKDLFFYTGLGVDEKAEGVTDEEFTKQRMNTYFNHFKQSYRFNEKAIAWLNKQSC